jgi:hypothetical protein
LERRTRLLRRARLAVVALVVGYFFLPYGVRYWIPVWLPFAAALALEVQFFLGGYLGRHRPQAAGAPRRGPQARDLADLGWPPEPEEDEEDDEEGEGDAETVVEPAEAVEPPDYEAVEPPAPAPRRSLPRRLAETLVTLAVVAGILYYAVRPHGWDAVSKANRARAGAVFSREATAIAGHPATVVCDTSFKHVGLVQEADGAAQVGGGVAWLLPSLCDTLYQVRFKHRVQSSPKAGRAIAVLAHEAWHLHGVANEGLANCYAFQSGVRIGVNLGLSESHARELMREQLATNASDSEGNPAYLVPPGCHNGGRYDLHPRSTEFP